MASHATYPGVRCFNGYLLFQVLKKKQKGTGDYYRDCVPDYATLFWVSEKINACFLIVGSFVLGCV